MLMIKTDTVLNIVQCQCTLYTTVEFVQEISSRVMWQYLLL